MEVLSEAERTRRLDEEVERYVQAGFRVVSRTPFTAQLVKPKSFNIGCALLGFLLLLAGLLLYMLYYVWKRDSTVYLTIDEHGLVRRQVAGDVPNFGPRFTADPRRLVGPAHTGDGRMVCLNCGHANTPARQTCTRCRAVLLT